MPIMQKLIEYSNMCFDVLNVFQCHLRSMQPLLLPHIFNTLRTAGTGSSKVPIALPQPQASDAGGYGLAECFRFPGEICRTFPSSPFEPLQEFKGSIGNCSDWCGKSSEN